MRIAIKIGLFLLFFGVIILNEAYGQLITDSDRRLKVTKLEKRPARGASSPSRSPYAGAFSRKSTAPRYSPSSSMQVASRRSGSPRSASGANYASVRRSVSPKYSAGSPFSSQQYASSPRYSSGSPFSGAKSKTGRGSLSASRQTAAFRSTQPRYSVGSPFSGKQLAVSPRYSQVIGKSQKRMAVAPRYSSPSPFGKEGLARSTPRYSVGNPFGKRAIVVSPRYSQTTPYQGNRIPVSPRYSVGNPFGKNPIVISPRYSQTNANQLGRVQVSPRYSQGRPFDSRKFAANPRYSTGSPFGNVRYIMDPDYSTMKHRFDVDKQLKKQNAIYNFETSRYKGAATTDFRLVASSKDLLKSIQFARYEGKSAHRKDWEELKTKSEPLMNYTNENIGNKGGNKDVSQKISKPKFDRKEAKIWND